jgi:hypothetical protein
MTQKTLIDHIGQTNRWPKRTPADMEYALTRYRDWHHRIAPLQADGHPDTAATIAITLQYELLLFADNCTQFPEFRAPIRALLTQTHRTIHSLLPTMPPAERATLKRDYKLYTQCTFPILQGLFDPEEELKKME